MNYDLEGRRKYLSPDERVRFIASAKLLPERDRLFCLLLVYTGMRISEASAALFRNFDTENGVVIVRSLKKRGRTHFRAVPVPHSLLADLHSYGRMRRYDEDDRVWKWCRTSAWSAVKSAMVAANIEGIHATPKGLRHGFAIWAIGSGVPLNLVQKWLGHASIGTTALYANAVGPEERKLASRMWDTR